MLDKTPLPLDIIKMITGMTKPLYEFEEGKSYHLYITDWKTGERVKQFQVFKIQRRTKCYITLLMPCGSVGKDRFKIKTDYEGNEYSPLDGLFIDSTEWRRFSLGSFFEAESA